MLVNEGFNAGQRIAKISVVTLISIGIAELLMGYISGSVVATADGVDSMSDAMISFIVLIGLRFARRLELPRRACRDDVGDEGLVLPFSLRHDQRVVHSVLRLQSGLDLAELDAETADLDLVVEAAQELEIA